MGILGILVQYAPYSYPILGAKELGYLFSNSH